MWHPWKYAERIMTCTLYAKPICPCKIKAQAPIPEVAELKPLPILHDSLTWTVHCYVFQLWTKLMFWFLPVRAFRGSRSGCWPNSASRFTRSCMVLFVFWNKTLKRNQSLREPTATWQTKTGTVAREAVDPMVRQHHNIFSQNLRSTDHLFSGQKQTRAIGVPPDNATHRYSMTCCRLFHSRKDIGAAQLSWRICFSRDLQGYTMAIHRWENA